MASLSSPQSQPSFCSTSWESEVIQTAAPSLSGFPVCSGQRQNPGKPSRTHLVCTGSPPCMSSSLCLSILLQAAAHLVLNTGHGYSPVSEPATPVQCLDPWLRASWLSSLSTVVLWHRHAELNPETKQDPLHRAQSPVIGRSHPIYQHFLVKIHTKGRRSSKVSCLWH